MPEEDLGVISQQIQQAPAVAEVLEARVSTRMITISRLLEALV
jgi:hypothetical protein